MNPDRVNLAEAIPDPATLEVLSALLRCQHAGKPLTLGNIAENVRRSRADRDRWCRTIPPNRKAPTNQSASERRRAEAARAVAPHLYEVGAEGDSVVAAAQALAVVRRHRGVAPHRCRRVLPVGGWGRSPPISETACRRRQTFRTRP